VKYGLVIPFGDARDIAACAVRAETAGWDAVFVAEGLWCVDAWISLTAAALATERIRLGTLITPVTRVKPWDLASRVATVDRLSGGRTVLGAGLGALHDGWLAFEPDQGRRTRVELLEECLAVYDGLMRGQPFAFEGRHYQARPTTFWVPDPPVQRPRPPVWLVGAWVPGRDAQPSLARAALWDGLLPQVTHGEGRAKADTPEELAGIVARVHALRAEAGLPIDGYDVVLEADSYGGFRQMTSTDPAAWADAGATWWVESWWDLDGSAGRTLLDRIDAGPPSQHLP
jgi:alkanesulfonate monooxygenase SsuD/methylene tetrahydromethanopterin reductase-like flavin-dependent oxidoreductase (luciferase family)